EIKYDKVEAFHNGVALVWLGSKCGWLNTQGSEIVACQYDQIGLLSGEYAVATLAGQRYVLNAYGKVISGGSIPKAQR
ncbi:MAG: hypothetical protein RI894_1252, partial [Bacteroidota bacterium]